MNTKRPFNVIKKQQNPQEEEFNFDSTPKKQVFLENEQQIQQQGMQQNQIEEEGQLQQQQVQRDQFQIDQEQQQLQQQQIQQQQQKQITKQQEKKAKYTIINYGLSLKEFKQEGFSYTANVYLRNFCKNTLQQIQEQFPLLDLMRGVARTFFLNEIEIMFFAYILEENQWQYNKQGIEDLVNSQASNVSKFTEVNNQKISTDDFLDILKKHKNCDNKEFQQQYKQMLLYLCLNAYAVKFYLNSKSEMEIFDSFLVTIYPGFQEYFQVWSKEYATKSLKINPKKLNKIYKSLGYKTPQGMQKNIQEDYNVLVDDIIQISPPYNNSMAMDLQQSTQQQDYDQQEAIQKYEREKAKKREEQNKQKQLKDQQQQQQQQLEVQQDQQDFNSLQQQGSFFNLSNKDFVKKEGNNYFDLGGMENSQIPQLQNFFSLIKQQSDNQFSTQQQQQQQQQIQQENNKNMNKSNNGMDNLSLFKQDSGVINEFLFTQMPLQKQESLKLTNNASLFFPQQAQENQVSQFFDQISNAKSIQVDQQQKQQQKGFEKSKTGRNDADYNQKLEKFKNSSFSKPVKSDENYENNNNKDDDKNQIVQQKIEEVDQQDLQLNKGFSESVLN